MLQNRKPVNKTGDCEASHFDGQGVDCNITLTHGNMWLCDDCLAKEEAVDRAKQVIEESRKTDSQIELKQDIVNAGTVAFVQLQAAIEANTDIPADKKNGALLTIVAARIEILNAAIFAEKAITQAKENERFAFTKNAKEIVAKLQEQERAKYPQFDITYKPAKVSKPKSVKAPGAKFNKQELFDAAKKYNVPASNVRSIMIAQNKSAEDAAKHLSDLLN